MVQPNMVQPNQKVEILRTLLEQHWHHCQHLESERAWFMSVYGAVAGGILAFITAGLDTNPGLNNSPLFYALISFLIVITFFGFFLNLRWAFAFECHRHRVNKLAKVLWRMSRIRVPLDPGEKSFDPTMDIPPVGFFKVFKTKFLFPFFYLVVLIGVTFLLCFVIQDHTWSKWLLFVIPLVAFLLGVWWCFLLKKAK